MKDMSTPEIIIGANEPIRPLKRIEYERLAAEGYFDDEKVELLFGMVIPMSPIDPAHSLSSYDIRRALEARLGDRAMVFEARPFAASDISEPEPDVLVTPPDRNYQEHPTRAFLVVEVARSSLRKDKGPKAKLYGLADVDEYWIVNHVDGVVEVYRDRRDGEWRSRSAHPRGETIAMLAFPDVTIAVADILPPTEL
jgi:Uma2 family endonuclease